MYNYGRREPKRVAFGRPFRTLQELIDYLNLGLYVQFGRRAYHPAMVWSWQLRMVCAYVKAKKLRRMRLNPKYRPPLKSIPF